MRDIQFVKNQFVSRIPKSLQTCFRAFLEKAFSNPLGKEVVLEQITEKAASVTFIFQNSEVGIEIPKKYFGSNDDLSLGNELLDEEEGDTEDEKGDGANVESSAETHDY